MRFPIRKRFVQPEDFGPLRMRLQRFGRTNYAFYNIVVAQARHRRNGQSHDIIGCYNPHPTMDGDKHIMMDFERIKYWLAAGAKPTSMVAKLLSKAGLLPSPPKRYELLQREQAIREFAKEREL